MATPELELAVIHLCENLLKFSKASVLGPLNRRLTKALRSRFRLQSKAVRKAITPLLKRELSEAAKADSLIPAGVALAALAALMKRRPLTIAERILLAAYTVGTAAAAKDLDIGIPGGLRGPTRDGFAIQQDIDKTTGDRIMSALETAIKDKLSASDAVGAVMEVFQDAMDDRAGVIAEGEVSRAFHDGMGDVAEATGSELDIEKIWEAEDDACEECLECADEEWVDYDFTYPAFGIDEPPGHVNCRCSITLRRAESD